MTLFFQVRCFLLFQIYIFHVEVHPVHTWYTQCVTFHSFPSAAWETAYTIFGMVMMWLVPLVVILCTYTAILVTLYRKSRAASGQSKYKENTGIL